MFEKKRNRLKFKTSAKMTDHFRGIYGIYTSNSNRKTETSQHVTSWTHKHQDLHRSYPKISPNNRPRQGRVKSPFYMGKGVEVDSKGKDMTMGVR
jgi:hypothetical protein